MKTIILAAISCSLFLAACGTKRDTESATKTDSTAVGDHTMVAANDDTLTGHQSHSSTTTMMGIMDKSMNDMSGLQSTGNPDIDFAATMKLHHMSAVEASQLVLAQGTDSTIKRMATKMLADQQKEINAFDAFIAAKQTKGSDSSFFVKSMAEMKKMNMNMDHSGSIDRQFVVMMIPHHQGAVDMSQLYLRSGRDPVMKQMASQIISSQKKEIKELENWLRSH